MGASTSIESIEKLLFQNLNRVILPGVKSGWLSPANLPTTAIALEVRGRVSGKKRTVPLVAWQWGDTLIVATFRGDRSQWLRNLASAEKARVWLAGEPANYRAFVMSRKLETSKQPGGVLGTVIEALRPSTYIGWAFAILEPPRARQRPPRKPKRAAKPRHR